MPLFFLQKGFSLLLSLLLLTILSFASVMVMRLSFNQQLASSGFLSAHYAQSANDDALNAAIAQLSSANAEAIIPLGNEVVILCLKKDSQTLTLMNRIKKGENDVSCESVLANDKPIVYAQVKIYRLESQANLEKTINLGCQSSGMQQDTSVQLLNIAIETTATVSAVSDVNIKTIQTGSLCYG
jgi:Tfp pilus assembly protein PilX